MATGKTDGVVQEADRSKVGRNIDKRQRNMVKKEEVAFKELNENNTGPVLQNHVQEQRREGIVPKSACV